MSIKFGSADRFVEDVALDLALPEPPGAGIDAEASVSGWGDSVLQSRPKNFRAAATSLGLSFGSLSFSAFTACRWGDGAEKAGVGAGHWTKSLMVESVCEYRFGFGVTLVLVFVFEADEVRSRPQRTCEVLSWRSVPRVSML